MRNNLTSLKQHGPAHACRLPILQHIDDEAPTLVKGIYNLLAREFHALETKAEDSEVDIDVVNEFNAKSGLNGDLTTSGRLTSVSLYEIDETSDPVAYGIQERKVKAGAMRLERSQRSTVLSRLMSLTDGLSNINKKGGDSGLEFAKVYRGREAIEKYLKQTAYQMRHAI